jgi:hypothetical protein
MMPIIDNNYLLNIISREKLWIKIALLFDASELLKIKYIKNNCLYKYYRRICGMHYRMNTELRSLQLRNTLDCLDGCSENNINNNRKKNRNRKQQTPVVVTQFQFCKLLFDFQAWIEKSNILFDGFQLIHVKVYVSFSSLSSLVIDTAISNLLLIVIFYYTAIIIFKMNLDENAVNFLIITF